MKPPPLHTTYGMGAALLCALLLGGIALWSSPERVATDDPVATREIVGYEVLPPEDGQEPTVQYQYLGEPAPAKLAADEVVELRTDSSYTRLVATETTSQGEKRTYNGVFFAQPAFAKEGDDWYYVEYATTTESAFNAVREGNAFASLFWRKAHADSVSPFANSGDGFVRILAAEPFFGEDFFICSDASSGTAADATSASVITVLANDNILTIAEEETYRCNLRRAFYPFSTASIPSSASISSATLNVYVSAKVNDTNNGLDYISVVQTSQASDTALVVDDFNNVTDTEGIDSGERKDLGSISTSAYLVFTLNSTGRSWIKKSGQSSQCSGTAGVTCLGLRIGHDFDDSGTGLVGNTNSITTSQSETTGTSQDPFLSVTYTTGSFAFWQFQDF